MKCVFALHPLTHLIHFFIASYTLLEGMTNSKISEVLAISQDAVKIRLHRARTMLRRAMGKSAISTVIRAINWPATARPRFSKSDQNS